MADVKISAKKSKRKRSDQIRSFNIACVRNDDNEEVEDDDVDPSKGENDYEKKYRGSVINDNEWAMFTRVLRQPLNVTVRLEVSCSAGSMLASNYDHYLRRCHSEQNLGKNVESILDVGKNCHVIQLPIDKKTLRFTPSLKKFNEQLARDMILGHLSRQEIVSMLPACIAGVSPGERLLELCACPGSKTRQMLSMLSVPTVSPLDHDGSNIKFDSSSTTSSSSIASSSSSSSSLLVSNDSDVLRMSMLSKQFETASFGANPNLVLTNARGDELCYRIQSAEMKRIQNNLYSSSFSSSSSLLFDKVFADVPCSGDGTFRKAPELWRQWSQDKALSLQPLQESLLTAAFAACAMDGLVVYSTCSLNPIENELVVRNVLYRHSLKNNDDNDDENNDDDYDIEIEDAIATAQMNGCKLKLRRGISDDKVLNSFSTSSSVPKDFNVNFLQKCCRVLPHDNNTGGFFITLLRKKRKTKSTQKLSKLSNLSDHSSSYESSSSSSSLNNKNLNLGLNSGVSIGLSKEASLIALHNAGFTTALPPKSENVNPLMTFNETMPFITTVLGHSNHLNHLNSSSSSSYQLLIQSHNDNDFKTLKNVKKLISNSERNKKTKSSIDKETIDIKSKQKIVYMVTNVTNQFRSVLPDNMIIRCGVAIAVLFNDKEEQEKDREKFHLIPKANVLPFLAPQLKTEIPFNIFVDLCREALKAIPPSSSTSSSLDNFYNVRLSHDMFQRLVSPIVSIENLVLNLKQMNNDCNHEENESSFYNTKEIVLFAYHSNSSMTGNENKNTKPRMSKKQRQLLKKNQQSKLTHNNPTPVMRTTTQQLATSTTSCTFPFSLILRWFHHDNVNETDKIEQNTFEIVCISKQYAQSICDLPSLSTQWKTGMFSPFSL